MDASIQKALHDKLYDKRKGGALELEKLIRECLAASNHDRIRKIVDQLCNDYAYAVHQPYARNGGLIGLAAASIALGPDVGRYLDQIVPPVLACFQDQDARVRYYACESMYNISKTSKGEILPYFNEMFDALAKLSADSELSVKNGAELLDRLIKDIVSESATSYVSVTQTSDSAITDAEESSNAKDGSAVDMPTAFSLSKFIPLLQERIYVLNPHTRMFLVQWITLLDSIPDLELVSYLPSFLGGLFRFLTDSNQDVVTATQHALEKFLDEIKLVARVKRGLAKKRNGLAQDDTKRSSGSDKSTDDSDIAQDDQGEDGEDKERLDGGQDRTSFDSGTRSDDDDETGPVEDDWVPGQGVQVDHPKILEILVTFLRDASEEHIQLTALRWIDSFFEICPKDILPFVPSLLNQVLPALASNAQQVRQAGTRVNNSLMEYIMSLSDEDEQKELAISQKRQPTSPAPADTSNKDVNGTQRLDSSTSTKPLQSGFQIQDSTTTPEPPIQDSKVRGLTNNPSDSRETHSLDYEGCVSALTLQFLNENEATRIAALSWLIMLQRKSPKRVLAAHDGTFPALLKTLSDPSDTVVTRDLQLLSQISKNSDDSYFTYFMVNLLKLFGTDRKLLETRGNLIIRQLCVNLGPERIYRIMADCLEKDEDVEFASIMVQNLNNNLITAPELADLRKKLRSWESRDGQTLFVALFRSWCHNAVATIALCLLAQAYEQAYALLQIFADIEMTVNMLIQIDKLVQLLESPVFTYLRIQLVEPERYPALYKCLYGILMLLPQSAAFAALKNRLNSVSAIGYLHVPSHLGGPSSAYRSNVSSTSASQTTPTSGTGPQAGSTGASNPSAIAPGFERSNRVNPRRDEGLVKWSELLDKFRSTQDRARRLSRSGDNNSAQFDGSKERKSLMPPTSTPLQDRPTSAEGNFGAGRLREPSQPGQSKESSGHKSKFSASNLSRFASGVKGKAKK